MTLYADRRAKSPMEELTEIPKSDSLYAKLLDANNLMVAAKLCMKGVTWKYSTQSYYLNRIDRVYVTKTRLERMDRMSDGFIVFWINERGKLRLIRSIHINERVVHRCENDDVLVPVLRPRLIYDNYSSLKERGTRRCFERLKCFLQREFRKYGDNESYILVWDLHSYFDSIDHDIVYEMYSKLFMESEKKNLYLLMDFIDAFGEVSLGLGSQVSQMTAMYYPNDIDHHIKEQLKIKGYGRYNDDFFLIHRSKEYLIHCADVIRNMYADKGIEMNENKLRICKIGKEFKFLKAKIHITNTGKVIIRPDRQCIVRERGRLKAMKEKVDNGEMEFIEVYNQFKAWRGYFEYFNSYRSIQRINDLFDDLFIKDWHRMQTIQRKEKKQYGYRDHNDKQSPACRRHGIELCNQWD